MPVRAFVALVLVGGLVTAGWAAELSCFDPSPLRQQLGEEYFEVDVPLSELPDPPPELSVLVGNIAGEWQGESSGFDCRGTDGNPEQVARHALITAQIADHTAGQLVIDYTRERPQQRVTNQDSLVLFEPGMLLQFQVTGPHRVVGSQRFRQGTAEGLSVLRQTDVSIEQRGDRLTLDRHYFVNGVMVGRETWRLSRP